MVYRAIFEHAGAAYCLDGAKHVRRRSVLHSWTDTTTLHCRLHAGTDTSAPIVAAGILRLRALDFARQLFSFRTVKSPTFAAKAAALATFFTFFARELLDTYFRRARRTASRAEDVRS
jgi:cholesterol oxidase